MSKIQTILSLFLFLVIVFSMDMILGNPLKETFNSDGVTEMGVNDVSETQNARTTSLNVNQIHSGSGFLGETSSYQQGDDQPLFFGFSQ